MKLTSMKNIIVGIAILSVTACGSATDTSTASTDDSGTEDATTAASAAAALFAGTSGSASVSALTIPRSVLNRYVQESLDEENSEQYEGGSSDTCLWAGQESEDMAEMIVTGQYGLAGTYGSEGEPMTVSENDFCTQPDGTENTGSGPDGLGLFATFELIDAVEGSCTSDDGDVTTIAMQSGSTGIWRNTEDPTYYPQVFGSFTYIIDNDNEFALDCTIYLNDDESVAFANCSDENGDVVVEEDGSANCEFTTE